MRYCPSAHPIFLIFIIILLSAAKASTTTDESTTESSTPTESSASTPTEDTGSTTETVAGDTGGTTETVAGDTGGTTETVTGDTGGTTETVTGDTGGTTETVTGDTGGTTETVTGDTGGTTDTATDDTGGTTETVTGDTGGTTETVTGDTGGTTETVTGDTGGTTETVTGDTGGTTETVTSDTGSTSDTTAGGTESTPETSTGGTGCTQDTQTESTATGGTVDYTQEDTASTVSATTTTTQTPTTKKYKYPTSPPNRGEAVYVLNIDVTIFGDGNIAAEKSPLIMAKFNNSFKDKVAEFKEIKIMLIGEMATATSEITPVKIHALFSADAMMAVADTTAFKLNVDNVMEEVQNYSVGVDFTIGDYSGRLDALVISARDVCAAEGDICPAVLEVCSSQDQLCVHRCEYKECGDNGQCTVVLSDENGNTQEPEAKCQCIQDDGLYERSGDNCDIETMKWQYVLAISGGVGGTIILVLIVLIACYCYRRSAKYKDRLEAEDDDVYLHDFNRSRSSRPSDNMVDFPRANQGYQPDDTYRYEGNPTGMSFLHTHDAQTVIEKQERALQSFGPGRGGVDPETRFSIKRPQVSSRH